MRYMAAIAIYGNFFTIFTTAIRLQTLFYHKLCFVIINDYKISHSLVLYEYMDFCDINDIGVTSISLRKGFCR